MGHFAPEPGEKHRMVVELEGRSGLTQYQYEAYKKAVTDVAKKYGAKVAIREYLNMKKKKKAPR